jgi:hypothetical protein
MSGWYGPPLKACGHYGDPCSCGLHGPRPCPCAYGYDCLAGTRLWQRVKTAAAAALRDPSPSNLIALQAAELAHARHAGGAP